MRAVGALLVMLCVVAITIVSINVCAGAAAASVATREEREALSQKAKNSLAASKRSLKLQTELRFGEEKSISAQDSFSARPYDFGPQRSVSFSPETATFLLYASILVIIIALVPALRFNLWSSSRARQLEYEEDLPENAPAAVSARMETAQLEADELARRGDFAEAMHVLLLQSVNELRRRLYVSIASSLTSREILRHIELPPQGRDLFADIIGKVEVSYFGTHRPGAEEYVACRRSFDELTAVLRQGGLS